jgi:hypothetical protein
MDVLHGFNRLGKQLAVIDDFRARILDQVRFAGLGNQALKKEY